MRLFRTDALRATPLPAGGYEAESRHLRALLAAGAPVASVDIPTIYDGEPSHFRPVADTIAVGRALRGAADVAAERATAATAAGGAARMGAAARRRLAAAIAIGLALPALPAGRQRGSSWRVNGLGDGPEWLYQALDPHARNYAILLLRHHRRGARSPPPAALRRSGPRSASCWPAYLAGAALEVVKLFVERARPEEVLGARCCSRTAAPGRRSPRTRRVT